MALLLILAVQHPKAIVVLILYSQQSLQLAVAAAAVILQALIRAYLVAPVVAAVILVAPLPILLAMVPVLPGKVTMVAPVLTVLGELVVEAEVRALLVAVCLQDHIHHPDIQAVRMAVSDYLHQ